MENKTSKNSKKLIIQCVILFLMLLVVAFSGQIFAEGDIVNTDMVAQKPSLEHIFGTDPLGRDVLSRSFIGLRLSLLLGFVTQFICMVSGVLVGCASAYFGGIPDKIFMFVQNVIAQFFSLFEKGCLC